MLIGLGVVLLLGVLVAGYFLLGRSTFLDGPESLHGIKIGDTVAEVEKQLGGTNGDVGNPWKLRGTMEYLGTIVKPEDLKLTPEELTALRVKRSLDNSVCVILHQGKVIAVISSDKNSWTTRRLHVGSDAGAAHKLYDEKVDLRVEVLPGGGNVEVRRHPTLGIGFEIHGSQVTGIALFPAVKDPEPGS